ncbi:hypothetical protein LX36DRAFT_342358 [Colletotrichum falcatum]|nr:hypothetical protein LX36DRAFT_342358 [Colletotrichum falcatum]
MLANCLRRQAAVQGGSERSAAQRNEDPHPISSRTAPSSKKKKRRKKDGGEGTVRFGSTVVGMAAWKQISVGVGGWWGQSLVLFIFPSPRPPSLGLSLGSFSGHCKAKRYQHLRLHPWLSHGRYEVQPAGMYRTLRNKMRIPPRVLLLLYLDP